MELHVPCKLCSDKRLNEQTMKITSLSIFTNTTLFHSKFNSLPNDKCLDRSKLKAFADDKLIVAEKLKFVLGRVENIVGKGENAGLQPFSPFPTVFSKAFFFRVIDKVGTVWYKVILELTK